MTTDDHVAVIAVVRRTPNVEVDSLFAMIVARWRHAIRIGAVISESHGLADRACNAGFLRNLTSNERYSMFQEHESSSKVCHLDPGGVLSATAAVQRDIAYGCDFAILSKFGKLETEGSGLVDAFTAAVEAGVPVLTSV